MWRRIHRRLTRPPISLGCAERSSSEGAESVIRREWAHSSWYPVTTDSMVSSGVSRNEFGFEPPRPTGSPAKRPRNQPASTQLRCFTTASALRPVEVMTVDACASDRPSTLLATTCRYQSRKPVSIARSGRCTPNRSSDMASPRSSGCPWFRGQWFALNPNSTLRSVGQLSNKPRCRGANCIERVQDDPLGRVLEPPGRLGPHRAVPLGGSLFARRIVFPSRGDALAVPIGRLVDGPEPHRRRWPSRPCPTTLGRTSDGDGARCHHGVAGPRVIAEWSALVAWSQSRRTDSGATYSHAELRAVNRRYRVDWSGHLHVRRTLPPEDIQE